MIDVIIPVGPGRKNCAPKELESQKEKVSIILEEGTNTSKNRNNGIQKSRSEIVAFVNGHTTMPNNWSEKIRIFFEKHPEVDVIGGPQKTPENDTRFGRLSGYALSSKFGAAGVTNRYSGKKIIFDADETSITSSNLAVRKKVLQKVKFDETIYPGEDPKFISDCKKNGFKVAYDPNIFVYNQRRPDWKKLAQQIFSYGVMRPKKENLAETIKRPLFLIPAMFSIYLAIFSILSLIHIIFLLPGFFYLILNSFFSIVEGIKRKDKLAIFVLPMIYFTIHISYGLGFLKGTFLKIFSL